MRPKLLHEINVTPLVDVMLVLLVIFMLTAPMLVVGVDVELPAADAPPIDASEEPLVVSIRADGRVFLQTREIAPKALAAKLAAIRARKPRLEVFVRADAKAPYAAVARALAAVERAGIVHVALITEPER
ncbi:MAG: protein TolR [Zetaproteobacteria bacterium]|nr:MAG: protein TolR [Zetaproteobacteria bacterium]